MRICSVGHGTRSFDELAETLASGGVGQVADVRSFPGSRRNPQFGKEAFEPALAGAGLAYRWMPRLGGRRRKGQSPSENLGWRVEAFRNYADYMDTHEFAEGIDELLAWAEEGLREGRGLTAYLCAETHFTQCHRRLISDKLWSLGHEVLHLITPSRQVPHEPTPFLKLDGARLRYPSEEPAQLTLRPL